MLIVTKVHTPDNDPIALAAIARGFLHGVVLVNRMLIRARLVPRLYESGVMWRQEPWRGQFEEFADALTCVQRGAADCEDCSAWLLAECYEAGEMGADFYITGRSRIVNGKPQASMHVSIRRADGTIEDPSRYLGMGPQ